MTELSPADLVSILSADEGVMVPTVTGQEEPFEEQPPIMDLVELGKYFRALATVRSRITEIEQTAKTEQERIEHWRRDETEKDLRRVAFLEGLIAHYALSRREGSKGHDKSLTTPYGRVETRDVPAEYVRVEADLLPWARKHGYAKTTTTETVDWARIKATALRSDGGILLLDGEVVPGVTVRDREPTVTVTPWE